jgi:hypothetical protein
MFSIKLLKKTYGKRSDSRGFISPSNLNIESNHRPVKIGSVNNAN